MTEIIILDQEEIKSAILFQHHHCQQGDESVTCSDLVTKAPSKKEVHHHLSIIQSSVFLF